MEIYRGGRLPQTVADWAEPAARALVGLKLPDAKLADPSAVPGREGKHSSVESRTTQR
jgi:hypothetical protein